MNKADKKIFNHHNHMNRHHTATHAVEDATNNIGTLVEQSKELIGNVRNKAVAGAKATHKAVNEHPYKAIGIALGIGAIFGFLLANRGSKKSEKSE
jgi:ElaB/YqjD/DUF883 family membrane-anchored ribosome-binding protein